MGVKLLTELEGRVECCFEEEAAKIPILSQFPQPSHPLPAIYKQTSLAFDPNLHRSLVRAKIKDGSQ
jgi:hypothetical protein